MDLSYLLLKCKSSVVKVTKDLLNALYFASMKNLLGHAFGLNDCSRYEVASLLYAYLDADSKRLNLE